MLKKVLHIILTIVLWLGIVAYLARYLTHYRYVAVVYLNGTE